MDTNGNESVTNKLTNNKGQAKYVNFISYNWDRYGEKLNSAPKECFYQNPIPPVNEFEISQKLEVTSPDNVDFIHLATVVNFFGPRLQLRLDGCDSSNDIFELIDSDNINPIGTRQKKNKYFAAPLRFRKDASSYASFCQHILKTAKPAPTSAFKTLPKRPLKNMFQVGMKLEAVDIKHPSNICPATIVSVGSNLIEIHLNGWDSTNDYKCSYLSRNLFPVGWCKETGHPLQFPGPKLELKPYMELSLKPNESIRAPTPTPPSENQVVKFKQEIDEKNDHLKSCEQLVKPLVTTTTTLSEPIKPTIILTNLSLKTPSKFLPKLDDQNMNSISKSTVINENSLVKTKIVKNGSKVNGNSISNNISSHVDLEHVNCNNIPKARNSTNQKVSELNRGLKRPLDLNPTKKKISLENLNREKTTVPMLINDFANNAIQVNSLKTTITKTVTNNSLPTIHSSIHDNGLNFNGENKLTSQMAMFAHNYPSKQIVNKWTIDEVVEFLNLRLPEFPKYENQFRSHEIDGKAFLLLTNESIIKFMNIKLGYSLKICDIVEKIAELTD